MGEMNVWGRYTVENHANGWTRNGQKDYDISMVADSVTLRCFEFRGLEVFLFCSILDMKYLRLLLALKLWCAQGV